MTLPCLAFLSAAALLGPGDCKAPTNATVVTTVPAPTKDGDLAAYVDPFTGTAGTGHTHPSACVPFGMVQAGPDTGGGRNADWAYCSGYQYRDTSVLGYSKRWQYSGAKRENERYARRNGRRKAPCAYRTCRRRGGIRADGRGRLCRQPWRRCRRCAHLHRR